MLPMSMFSPLVVSMFSLLVVSMLSLFMMAVLWVPFFMPMGFMSFLESGNVL
jgi:hypothetical protein